MPAAANLAYETSTTTGTGDFTTSAVTGWNRLDVEVGTGPGNTVWYFIRHQTAAEYEIGVSYMSATGTLVRDGNQTVIRSSNSNAAVNFSAGTKDVTLDVPAARQSRPILHVQDEKTSGTNAGSFTSGAFRTRVLNTVKTNEIAGASLASNQITLPAGTYEILAYAPAYNCAFHWAKLVDVTNTVDLLNGSSMYTSDTTSNVVTLSVIAGRFTLAAQAALEIQHRCTVTKTTNGLGIGTGLGTETYARALIWKVG